MSEQEAQQFEDEMRRLLTEKTDAALRKLLGGPFISSNRPPEPLTAEGMMRSIEVFNERQAERAGFVVVHPEDWPALRAGVEARGIAVYEDEEQPCVFYIGGWKYGSRYLDPETGKTLVRTRYTGTRVHLMPDVTRGKLLVYTPPKDDPLGRWEIK